LVDHPERRNKDQRTAVSIQEKDHPGKINICGMLSEANESYVTSCQNDDLELSIHNFYFGLM
jgi:hypothetical protein